MQNVNKLLRVLRSPRPLQEKFEDSKGVTRSLNNRIRIDNTMVK
jgi:hypothetical protein